MAELFDTISSIDSSLLKFFGMVFSGIVGVIMSWISRRSVNYRKINYSSVLEAVLFVIMLNVFVFVMIFVTVIIGTILIEMNILLGLDVNYIPLTFFSVFMSIISILIFWGLIMRLKKMKRMTERAKSLGKRFFVLLNGLSMFSVFLSFLLLPFMMTDTYITFFRIMNLISWILTIWWFILIISFVWRTSKYIFSKMKITLVDGELVEYSCSPKMCRVHKHYLRLLKRDENGIIIYERHINEASIKQIEYY